MQKILPAPAWEPRLPHLLLLRRSDFPNFTRLRRRVLAAFPFILSDTSRPPDQLSFLEPGRPTFANFLRWVPVLSKPVTEARSSPLPPGDDFSSRKIKDSACALESGPRDYRSAAFFSSEGPLTRHALGIVGPPSMRSFTVGSKRRPGHLGMSPPLQRAPFLIVFLLLPTARNHSRMRLARSISGLLFHSPLPS